jgi:septal ring factor EnvC (AmiA/AmiB activator)
MSNHKEILAQLRKDSEVAQLNASLADQRRHRYELEIKVEDLALKIKNADESIIATEKHLLKLTKGT